MFWQLFEGSTDLAKYGSIIQNLYSFQDDVLVPVDNVDALRTVNIKMTAVNNMMQTTFNSKSGYVIMGPKHLAEEGGLHSGLYLFEDL